MNAVVHLDQQRDRTHRAPGGIRKARATPPSTHRPLVLALAEHEHLALAAGATIDPDADGAVARRSRLARAVLLAIARHSDTAGQLVASWDTLAELTGLPTTDLRDAVALLEANGLLRRTVVKPLPTRWQVIL